MLRVLFIADHHIKLGQKNVPEDWARNRFNMLWSKVYETARENEVDTIIHGGDIFDRIPTPKEYGIMLEMFYALRHFRHIVYPGNHEATSKFKSFWEEFTTLEKIYDLKIIHEFTEIQSGVHILPYTDLKKKDWHGTEGKILFTHVRGEIAPHVQPEIDLSLFDTWDKVYAGDLHAHSNSQRNMVYPGAPVTSSFHRGVTKAENGVLIIDLGNMDHKFIDLTLPQLIRRTVNNTDDMEGTDFHHTIYELVGDASDLANASNHELLDKKIVTRDTEATLSLKDKTIEEELDIYLTEVEKIKNPQEIITEYVDIKGSSLE